MLIYQRYLIFVFLLVIVALAIIHAFHSNLQLQLYNHNEIPKLVLSDVNLLKYESEHPSTNPENIQSALTEQIQRDLLPANIAVKHDATTGVAIISSMSVAQRTLNALPPDLPLYLNFSDTTDPFRPGNDVPFYWRIAKSASTATVAYLTMCLDLVVASQKGANFDDPDLRIISQGDIRFVNVDVTTIPGIERAGRQELVRSGLANFIASGRLLEAAEHIYTQEYRGRLFSVFRHPVERMVSTKEYLAKANWERLYNPKLANMTIEQYITDENPMNNPVVRQLVNKQSKHTSLLPEDLALAKEILKRKCLVGLIDHLEESMLRFQRYFRWEAKVYKWNGKEIQLSECKQQYIVDGRNRNPHEKLERGSVAWGMVMQFNDYDVSLYDYIVELFHQQSHLFP